MLGPLEAAKLEAEIARMQKETELKEKMLPYQQRKTEAEIGRLGAQAKKTSASGKKPQEYIAGQETIPGFIQLTNIKPTEKDKEELKKAMGVSLDINNLGSRLISNVQKHGITSGLGISEGDRLIAQDIKAFQLKLKDLAGLGALTGPDMDILNKSIGAIQGPQAMAFADKQSAINQIKSVLERAQAGLDSSASSRGFAVKGREKQPMGISAQQEARRQELLRKQQAAR
jgi:hypothetical protein